MARILPSKRPTQRGGYGGKPFKLMLHNDSAIWGAASNEIVKMVYDERVWAMFGSISADTTHIALRVTLKAETPLVNSASTDPTIPETIIPWYFTDLQDDRLQGYTLARHIYTELGLKRVAILRVNDRYGRFGVLEVSRRIPPPRPSRGDRAKVHAGRYRLSTTSCRSSKIPAWTPSCSGPTSDPPP